MIRITIALAGCVLAGLLVIPERLAAQDFSFDLETGGAWFSRNDVRIPNDGGTEFDMLELIGTSPVPYLRFRIEATFDDRHTVRLLFAPLRKVGSGAFDEEVIFEGTTYEPDLLVDGTYQFSTYRATYRYTFFDRSGWTLGAGASALIRDAEVRLVQGERSEANTDLGFVPLLHLYAARHIGDRTSVVFDAETLAGPQGRATDAALTLNVRMSDDWELNAGYRLLEGGADVDEVYNFSWINFGMIGLRVNL
jgi:hypothetical protein